MTYIINSGYALYADDIGLLDSGHTVKVQKIKPALADRLGVYAVCGSFSVCSAIDTVLNTFPNTPEHIYALDILKMESVNEPDIIGIYYGQVHKHKSACSVFLITKYGQLFKVEERCQHKKDIVVGAFSNEIMQTKDLILDYSPDLVASMDSNPSDIETIKAYGKHLWNVIGNIDTNTFPYSGSPNYISHNAVDLAVANFVKWGSSTNRDANLQYIDQLDIE